MFHLHRNLVGAVATLALGVALTPSTRAQCAELEVTSVPSGAEWKRSFLDDVDALAPDDAWAVGFYDVPNGTPGSNTLSLALHWDGTSWTQTPTQNPSPHPTGTAVRLRGVAAIAPDDVWAGGERYGDAGGLSVGAWIHVQHWDGSTWEEVDVPQPPGGVSSNFSGTRIYAVEGFAADDVWFGGAWAEPNAQAAVDWRPLAMRWNGSQMEIADTPVIDDPSTSFGFSIRDMASLGPDDVWAVCAPNTATEATRQNVVLHYDGASWERVDIPDSDAAHVLREIVPLAPDDVWVFGSWYFPAGPFALHFDGSTWTEVADPPLANAAAADGGDGMYLGNTDLSRFDGTDLVLVDDLGGVVAPVVRAIDVAGPCSVWIVGRQLVGSTLLPLAARIEGGVPGGAPWATVPGGVVASHGAQPQLHGAGTLAERSATELRLSDAVPGVAATLVVGAAELGAPFKGGVLVPTPDKLLHGVTDATGSWVLGFAWPAGVPSGFSAFFQAWMPDAAAPGGFAASHGLSVTQP